MRLLSWNCLRGQVMKEKFEKIASLSPDIAVIQECPHPNKIQNADGYDAVWEGEDEGLGLGVFSFSDDYKLSKLIDKTKYEWIVPIKVSGKEDFILIAVWTKKCPGYSSYGKLLYSALKDYEEFLRKYRVIVIGDFNIDKKLPRSYSGLQRGKGFEQIIELFSSHGLESCYHYFTKEEFGSESKATYHHYKKSNLPFHIDYCFVSKEIMKRTKHFSINLSNEWKKYSDHFPLVLETELD